MMCSHILKIFCKLKVFQPNLFLQRIGKMHILVPLNILESNVIYSNLKSSIYKVPINKIHINNETRISLILPNGKLVSATLQEAKQLSERKNLKLIKIVDSKLKDDKILYKLISKSQIEKKINLDYDKSQIKKKVNDSKLLVFTPNISNHDLEVKIKHMIRFLNKQRKVEVRIQKGNDSSRLSEIQEIIVKALVELTEKYEKRDEANQHKLIFQPLRNNNQVQKCEKSDQIIQEKKC